MLRIILATQKLRAMAIAAKAKLTANNGSHRVEQTGDGSGEQGQVPVAPVSSESSGGSGNEGEPHAREECVEGAANDESSPSILQADDQNSLEMDEVET